ncbi:hypothetical protein F383_25161 [Gossypium arboreum]|uniref:Uncharacterized protein n=1 Tax=Gossypium arboreum TaxID=29729 RepID=A0A0B0NXE2_GOSAR|nr:hypothetical protein F383_25161 [Gossypium arboreum]
MNSLDTSDMIMRLPFWLRSCICCGLTIAPMSLLIYQLLDKAYRFSSIKLTISLDRAYRFSLIELTVSAQEELIDHGSKEHI